VHVPLTCNLGVQVKDDRVDMKNSVVASTEVACEFTVIDHLSLT
jgi:hypothetical protein